MGENVTRRVLLQVLATEKHCNNSCASINFTNNPRIAECLFFNEEMAWDDRKQTNGYIRLSACRKAEIHQSESSASERWLSTIRRALAEGNLLQGSEALLLVREIDRLRTNEVNIQSDLTAAIRREQEMKKAMQELHEQMRNMMLGMETMLNGD